MTAPKINQKNDSSSGERVRSAEKKREPRKDKTSKLKLDLRKSGISPEDSPDSSCSPLIGNNDDTISNNSKIKHATKRELPRIVETLREGNEEEEEKKEVR